MNNLLSYCGLVNAKIRASDKDLPLMSLDTLEVRVSFTVLPTYLRRWGKNQTDSKDTTVPMTLPFNDIQ